MKKLKRLFILSFSILILTVFIVPCFAKNEQKEYDYQLYLELEKPDFQWIAMQGSSIDQLNLELPQRIKLKTVYKDSSNNLVESDRLIDFIYIDIKWNFDGYDPTSDCDEYVFSANYQLGEKCWVGYDENIQSILLAPNLENLSTLQVHLKLLKESDPAGLIIYEVSDFYEYYARSAPYLLTSDISSSECTYLQYSLDNENWITALDGDPLSYYDCDSPASGMVNIYTEMRNTDTPFQQYYEGSIPGFYMRLFIHGSKYNGYSQTATFPYNFDNDSDTNTPVNPPLDSEGGEGNQGNIGGNIPDDPQDSTTEITTPIEDNGFSATINSPVKDIEVISNEKETNNLNENIVSKNEDLVAIDNKEKKSVQAEKRELQIASNTKKGDTISLSYGIFLGAAIVSIIIIITVYIIKKSNLPKFHS